MAVYTAEPKGVIPVDTAIEFDTILLGYIEEMGRTRRILGPYLEDERGYSTASPCYAWMGAFKHGRPYVLTHRRSRSVLKMLAHQHLRKGRIYQACGHSDCINPLHLGTVHYWRHQERDPETMRFL
jgi:hypothetical protein